MLKEVKKSYKMKTLIKLIFAIFCIICSTAQMIEEESIMSIMFLGLSVAYTFQIVTSKNKKGHE